MLELAGREKNESAATPPHPAITPHRGGGGDPSSGQTERCDRERAQAKSRDFIQQFNIKHHQDREEEEEEERGRGGAGAGRDVGPGPMTYEHLACGISGHFVLVGDASKQQLHHMTTHRQTHNGL